MFICSNMLFIFSQIQPQRSRAQRMISRPALPNHIYSSTSYFRLNLIIECGVRVRCAFLFLCFFMFGVFSFHFFTLCVGRSVQFGSIRFGVISYVSRYFRFGHCFQLLFFFDLLICLTPRGKRHFNINK